MALAELVVDMQGAFFAHARLTRHRAELAANVNELTHLSREHGVTALWVKTEFEADLRDASLGVREKAFPIVVKGSAGAGLLPELHVADSDPMLTKKRYRAFFGTSLDSILSARDCSRVVVAGVNTHACIRSTVVDA